MEKQYSDLHAEIVDMIVESLNLHFVDKSTLSPETSLMGDGLGLDSVDILEVVVAVEQRYGVKIESAEQGREVFATIGSVADYVAQQRGRVPEGSNTPEQRA